MALILDVDLILVMVLIQVLIMVVILSLNLSLLMQKLRSWGQSSALGGDHVAFFPMNLNHMVTSLIKTE